MWTAGQDRGVRTGTWPLPGGKLYCCRPCTPRRRRGPGRAVKPRAGVAEPRCRAKRSTRRPIGAVFVRGDHREQGVGEHAGGCREAQRWTWCSSRPAGSMDGPFGGPAAPGGPDQLAQRHAGSRRRRVSCHRHAVSDLSALATRLINAPSWTAGPSPRRRRRAAVRNDGQVCGELVGEYRLGGGHDAPVAGARHCVADPGELGRCAGRDWWLRPRAVEGGVGDRDPEFDGADDRFGMVETVGNEGCDAGTSEWRRSRRGNLSHEPPWPSRRTDTSPSRWAVAGLRTSFPEQPV